MPMYEFRCEPCGHVSSIYFPTSTSTPTLACRDCGSDDLHRIMSSFAAPTSELDKMSKLDPKYHKRVDAALAKAPTNSHPDYHMRKMVPFSKAKE